LQAAFDDIALFFYDVYGGNYIGVVWKPLAAETDKQIKVGDVLLTLIHQCSIFILLAPRIHC